MRLALVPLALALAVSALRGQAADSVWMGGTVVDSTGAPIRDAVLVLRPDALSARTDSVGAFLLRVPVGPATLVVRRLGFAPFEAELQLERGRDRRFRIMMTPLATTLEAVETTARAHYMPPGAPASLDDFYRRRAEGKGRTFTREEMERLGSFRASLATVPGIRVESDALGNVVGVTVPRCNPTVTTTSSGVGVDRTSESSAGGNAVAWFVDGRQVQTVPELRDQDIEAIEVYRGSSALPAEAIGNACAAVFVWTRREP